LRSGAPTVVTYKIEAGANGEWSIGLDAISEGPLQWFLKERLEYPERFSLNSFSLPEQCRGGEDQLADQKPGGNRSQQIRQHVVRTARHIGKALYDNKTGLLTRLARVLKEACRIWSAENVDEHGPFAVYVELRCDSELLRYSVDLALPTSGDDHLCTTIPVVWRLRRSGPFRHDREYSVIHYSGEHFRAAYSCADDFHYNGKPHPGVRELPGGTQAVLDAAGVKAEPAYVRNEVQLRCFLRNGPPGPWRSDKLPRPCSGKLPRPFTARGRGDC